MLHLDEINKSVFTGYELNFILKLKEIDGQEKTLEKSIKIRDIYNLNIDISNLIEYIAKLIGNRQEIYDWREKYNDLIFLFNPNVEVPYDDLSKDLKSILGTNKTLPNEILNDLTLSDLSELTLSTKDWFYDITITSFYYHTKKKTYQVTIK